MATNKSSGSNKIMVPQARAAMNKFKMEAASEVGVDLKKGYNGSLTTREAGSVGGQMVKKMIQSYEQRQLQSAAPAIFGAGGQPDVFFRGHAGPRVPLGGGQRVTSAPVEELASDHSFSRAGQSRMGRSSVQISYSSPCSLVVM